MPYLKEREFAQLRLALEKVRGQSYRVMGELAAEAYVTSEPVPFARRAEGTRLVLSEGDQWAENTFDCAWFHFTGIAPDVGADRRLVLLIDVSGEGLVVDENGSPVRGLTCVDSEFDFSLGKPGKWVLPLKNTRAGDPIEIWMDAGANDLFGRMRNDGRLKTARIAAFDPWMDELYFDLLILLDLMDSLNEKSARRNQVLFALYEGLRQVKAYDRAGLAPLSAACKRMLAKRGGDPSLTLTAIGHAHIDLAWLWPLRETRRKGARTFATALANMEEDPEYLFGASQPQLYQWVKEDHPDLYARVKEKIAQGRWEAQGCMWVEADVNVSSGEALVRQILYGKRFFEKEFGVEVRNLWLPDVFGYSAALPQLLKKSGVDTFMTQKLSWSQHNRFPHQTFLWQGIDGSTVFAHMLPGETYNSPLLPSRIRFNEENYTDSGLCEEALVLYGIGDGGGGPGMEHIEAARRVRDLAGIVPVKQGFAQPLFDRMQKQTAGRLQKWVGELYLERHQGTYTSQARNKRYNRKMELALRDAELYGVLSGIYPRAELESIWKEVLLYQFHDILPGSSIARVYEESCARYAQLTAQTEGIIQKQLAALHGGKTAAYNSLSWPRTEVVTLGGQDVRVTVPAMGSSCEFLPIPAPQVRAEEGVLENGKLKAVFDSNGALVSLVDKTTGREALAEKSGVFSLYRDEPADNWDIPIEYSDFAPEAFCLIEQRFAVRGARAVCSQQYRFGDSALTAEITLTDGEDQLVYAVEADWQENQKMLRTAFAANVLSDTAAFEIQYGSIRRPTHDNTLWDKAKFEVCGQKWVDISQKDFGLALMNDCKYGFRVHGSTLDMDLLRAQNYPDTCADRGHQVFTYAVYPHAGDEVDAKVAQAAYELNVPLRIAQGETETAPAAASCFGADGVIIEAVKLAEDSEDVILRAYEPHGRNAHAVIRLNASYSDIFVCDLMEKHPQRVGSGRTVELDVKPFEIMTLMLHQK